MFGLTMGEIKFISRASGLKPPQFMEQDEISPEFEKPSAGCTRCSKDPFPTANAYA
jgi:hypothetical protein